MIYSGVPDESDTPFYSGVKHQTYSSATGWTYLKKGLLWCSW